MNAHIVSFRCGIDEVVGRYFERIFRCARNAYPPIGVRWFLGFFLLCISNRCRSLAFLQHTVEQLCFFELAYEIAFLINIAPIEMYNNRSPTVDCKHRPGCYPVDVVVYNVVVGEAVEKQSHKHKAQQNVYGLKPDISLYDILAATGNVVRHAEQFVDNKLAKEHRGCNNNAKAYQQQPSRPTEMIESEGQKHGYKQYCDKRALKSFFYYGCFHTSAKIAIKLEKTYKELYILKKTLLFLLFYLIKTTTIKGQDGRFYAVKTLKDGYEIKSPDGAVKVNVNGKTLDVTTDQCGLNQVADAAGYGWFYASR